MEPEDVKEGSVVTLAEATFSLPKGATGIVFDLDQTGLLRKYEAIKAIRLPGAEGCHPVMIEKMRPATVEEVRLMDSRWLADVEERVRILVNICRSRSLKALDIVAAVERGLYEDE